MGADELSDELHVQRADAAILLGDVGEGTGELADQPVLSILERAGHAAALLDDQARLGDAFRQRLPVHPLAIGFGEARGHPSQDRLQPISAGDFAQGGSTITQQVAKQFLGSEKSLTRKAKEAIMARRLEATYSKEAILSVYLNQIYLGKAVHKGMAYPGEHKAIVSKTLWDDAQRVFKSNRQKRSDAPNMPNNVVLLKGILFDDAGNPMSPHYAKKG
ncbi:MAG: transglycosylase domain-containing protein, partial [Chloroflexi bacterium]|nr:transglycosylase domain-containing protein [Chloroflexota bacterium]